MKKYCIFLAFLFGQMIFAATPDVFTSLGEFESVGYNYIYTGLSISEYTSFLNEYNKYAIGLYLEDGEYSTAHYINVGLRTYEFEIKSPSSVQGVPAVVDGVTQNWNSRETIFGTEDITAQPLYISLDYNLLVNQNIGLFFSGFYDNADGDRLSSEAYSARSRFYVNTESSLSAMPDPMLVYKLYERHLSGIVSGGFKVEAAFFIPVDTSCLEIKPGYEYRVEDDSVYRNYVDGTEVTFDHSKVLSEQFIAYDWTDIRYCVDQYIYSLNTKFLMPDFGVENHELYIGLDSSFQVQFVNDALSRREYLYHIPAYVGIGTASPRERLHNNTKIVGTYSSFDSFNTVISVGSDYKFVLPWKGYISSDIALNTIYLMDWDYTLVPNQRRPEKSTQYETYNYDHSAPTSRFDVSNVTYEYTANGSTDRTAIKIGLDADIDFWLLPEDSLFNILFRARGNFTTSFNFDTIHGVGYVKTTENSLDVTYDDGNYDSTLVETVTASPDKYENSIDYLYSINPEIGAYFKWADRYTVSLSAATEDFESILIDLSFQYGY